MNLLDNLFSTTLMKKKPTAMETGIWASSMVKSSYPSTGHDSALEEPPMDLSQLQAIALQASLGLVQSTGSGSGTHNKYRTGVYSTDIHAGVPSTMGSDLSPVEPCTLTIPDNSAKASARDPAHRNASTSSDHVSYRSVSSSFPSGISSKATTPIDAAFYADCIPSSMSKKHMSPEQSTTTSLSTDFRPKISIPAHLTSQEYAAKCIAAAEWTMLNPVALHQDEYSMLRNHLSPAQVTTYLHIRNGILRLWVANPTIAVTRKEAVGCARDSRWLGVASLCFDWLVRNGHINYGCTKFGTTSSSSIESHSPKTRRKTIAIVGAGMAGIGCARQLDSLFREYANRFHELNEEPPRIVVVEGRKRIGGRLYSRQLCSEHRPSLHFEGKRCTVEMGGMIVTGFERGNPLNAIVRGQLKLPYYTLKADLELFDTDGKIVDKTRDAMLEALHNDLLDRVSRFKFKLPTPKLIEGNRNLIYEGRDCPSEGHKTIAQVEESTAALPNAPSVSQQNLAPHVDLVPVSTDRVTGRPHFEPSDKTAYKTAVQKVKSIGWQLRKGVAETADLDLDKLAQSPGATFGSVLDGCINQYKKFIHLSPQDLRLYNWHVANLEYSNAINYREMSLYAWDIDAGNEWEGKHSTIIGGYQSVAYGLAVAPQPLDVRTQAPVTSINYGGTYPEAPVAVQCEDGSVINADMVVCTIPLGVLKHGNVLFQPPLPDWKQGPIDRLGFGVLNKVILIYDKPFWDTRKDFFGVLRSPPQSRSLNQRDYKSHRGRFFQWLDVTKTAGVPALLAFMAGDAATDVEHSSNDELIAEATDILKTCFETPQNPVPQPREVFVTRWASDRFTRGSYSSAGPTMHADDYDVMAAPIGNRLFFAGEHTSGSHPATVHGAYLSGLRAASQVLDALIGPISVPSPLVRPKELLKRKAGSISNDDGKHQRNNSSPTVAFVPPLAQESRRARREAHELACAEYVTCRIGDCPPRPRRKAGNAYMLFFKDRHDDARTVALQRRRTSKSRSLAAEIRNVASKMWREAGDDVKQPYRDEASRLRSEYMLKVQQWQPEAHAWEEKAAALREEFARKCKDDIASSGFGCATGGGASTGTDGASSDDDDGNGTRFEELRQRRVGSAALKKREGRSRVSYIEHASDEEMLDGDDGKDYEGDGKDYEGDGMDEIELEADGDDE